MFSEICLYVLDMFYDELEKNNQGGNVNLFDLK